MADPILGRRGKASVLGFCPSLHIHINKQYACIFISIQKGKIFFLCDFFLLSASYLESKRRQQEQLAKQLNGPQITYLIMQGGGKYNFPERLESLFDYLYFNTTRGSEYRRKNKCATLLPFDTILLLLIRKNFHVTISLQRNFSSTSSALFTT